jgi:hypothetical protein
MITAGAGRAPSAIMDCRDEPGNDRTETVMQDFAPVHNPTVGAGSGRAGERQI